jgi:DNA-binding GntR family transcriptional regulator
VHASDGRSWILQYDHRLILDAIRRKDAEEAADIMRLHTRRARQALEQHPDLFPSTGRRKEKPRTHA